MTPEKSHFQENLGLNQNTPEQLEKLKNDLREKIDTLKADGAFSGEDLDSLVDLLDDKTILSPTEAELKSHLENLNNLNEQIDFLMALVYIGEKSSEGNGVEENNIGEESGDSKKGENIIRDGEKNENKNGENKFNKKLSEKESFGEEINGFINEFNLKIENKEEFKLFQQISTNFVSIKSRSNSLINIESNKLKNIGNENIKSLNYLIDNIKEKGKIENSDLILSDLILSDLKKKFSNYNEKDANNILTKKIDNINDIDELIAVFNYLEINKEIIIGRLISIGSDNLNSLNTEYEFKVFLAKIVEKIEKFIESHKIETEITEKNGKLYLKRIEQNLIQENTENIKVESNKSQENNENTQADSSSSQGHTEIIETDYSTIKITKKFTKEEFTKIKEISLNQGKEEVEKVMKSLENENNEINKIDEYKLKVLLSSSKTIDTFNKRKNDIEAFLKNNDNFLININQIENNDIAKELIKINLKVPEKNFLNIGGISGVNLNKNLLTKDIAKLLIKLSLNVKDKDWTNYPSSILYIINKYVENGGNITDFSYLKEEFEGKGNENFKKNIEIMIKRHFNSNTVKKLFGEDKVNEIKNELMKVSDEKNEGLKSLDQKEINELLNKGELEKILVTRNEEITGKNFYIYEKEIVNFLEENISDTKKIVEILGNLDFACLSISYMRSIQGLINEGNFKELIGAKDKKEGLIFFQELRRNFSDSFLKENQDIIIENINKNNDGELNHHISRLLPLGEDIENDLIILTKLENKGISFSDLKTQDQDKIYIFFHKNLIDKNIGTLKLTEKYPILNNILEDKKAFINIFKSGLNDKINTTSVELKKITDNSKIERLNEEFKKLLLNKIENNEKFIEDIPDENGKGEFKKNNIITQLLKDININNIGKINTEILEALEGKTELIREYLEILNTALEEISERINKELGNNQKELEEFLKRIQEENPRKKEIFERTYELYKEKIRAANNEAGKEFNQENFNNNFLEENFINNPEYKDDFLEFIRLNKNISDSNEGLKSITSQQDEVKLAVDNTEEYINFKKSGYTGTFKDYAKENNIILRNKEGEIINGIDLNLSKLSLYSFSGNEYNINLESGTFKSKNGKEIPLTQTEVQMIQKSPEAAANIINLYESLEKTGMTKIWNYKEQIFKSIENVFNFQFDRNDGNYLDERETKILFNAILSSLGENSIKMNINMDNFLSQVENKNGRQISGVETQVNNLGESKFEANFIDKFVGRGDLIGFKQSAFENSLRNMNK